jgi:hypothetical protein
MLTELDRRSWMSWLTRTPLLVNALTATAAAVAAMLLESKAVWVALLVGGAAAGVWKLLQQHVRGYFLI